MSDSGALSRPGKVTTLPELVSAALSVVSWSERIEGFALVAGAAAENAAQSPEYNYGHGQKDQIERIEKFHP